jgi:uncharacterized protein involved in type VI secretion and phage assembly
MEGLLIGTVVENFHKDHPGCVRIKLGALGSDNSESFWLPVASVYAGKGYGIYFLPEVGSSVVVGFLDGDMQSGVVLGSLWNTNNTLPPKTANDENNTRLIMTKGGHSITIVDGDKGKLTIKTAAGHSLTIDEKDKKISLATSDGKNTLVLDEKGKSVSLESADKLNIKAKTVQIDGDVTIKGKSFGVNSNGKLELKGKQTEISATALKLNAQASFEAGGATAKLEGKGLLELKGGMVKVN